MTATTEPGPRILTLDVVRGIAVMGILTANIVGFGLPEAAYVNPLAWGGETVADLWTWAATFVLFEGKMRGLFSLLFGASMALVVERAGERGASVHFRRMFWLLIFGLIHQNLIWDGDILVQYAIVGCLAYFFVGSRARTLRRTAIGLLAASCLFHMAVMAGATAQVVASQSADATPAQRAETETMLAGFADPRAPGIPAEVALYAEGSYGDILADRSEFGAARPFFTLFMFGFETLGLMLLGILMLGNGFLAGTWDAARYRRWALVAYAIGIPPLVAFAAWNWSTGFATLPTFATWLAWAEPFKYAVLVGHAATIMLLVGRIEGSALAARIAATGRAAFTNYLGTSIVMTTLFYGYGFGLFGSLDRLQLWIPLLAMWALMLVWSKPWLDRFRYGPFEWAWRSLARGRLEPMRR